MEGRRPPPDGDDLFEWTDAPARPPRPAGEPRTGEPGTGEPGTGERVADTAVSMLEELAKP